jgi:CRISPR type III-associated protein (TIGR04423 family)
MEYFELNNIREIPDLNYQGYYWLSNEDKPVEILNNKLDKSVFKDLPFVVEANFYAVKEQISISVKNVDGKYHIYQYNLKDVSIERRSDITYLAHKTNSKKFVVTRVWNEYEDQNLLGMKTLIPLFSAFTGFKN